MGIRVHIDVDDLLATFTAAYAKASGYSEIALRKQIVEDKVETHYWIEPGDIKYWNETQRVSVETRADSYARMTDLEPGKAMLVIGEEGFEFRIRET